eukprot:CAMPEP_0114453912 /NCGR_PEP_ID=MMETSP0104-20121206/2302_1 /TAXON_ID=37642 ORGANISM="Paraphysomonas imperforata, Strain PA2" /NCGR_SAMPLE_ID=MMETSP0104 /ASSEMBLY_ACC=CAM_ASM_000202 /LENGTH=719 /DNA_ID=CAMNT_0001626263 /DNA_START=433 /DNA_END=2591 /DNA_ORIENTATION=+
MTTKGRQVLSANHRLNEAVTFKEWKQTAEELDHLNGLDAWRLKDESSLYDCRVLRKRSNDIKWMTEQGDIFNLMFRIRGGLARDMYGMQHEGLFSKAAAGTKTLVEDYHSTVAAALNYICDSTNDEIPTDAKLAFFNETRHSYGRSALLLSGGAALGFYHIGLVLELLEQGLLPRVISGASAGSLIAAVIGTRTDEELEYLGMKHGGSLRKDHLRFGWEKTSKSNSAAKFQFQYLFPPSLRWVADAIFGVFFDNKSLVKFDTEHLKEVVQHNCGVALYTFQEAFDRTGRIVNIIVAPTNNYDPPRLLNYLTAPHVCMWSAAVASCAIPGVFDAVPLMVKEPDGEFRPENEWTRQGRCSESDDQEVPPNLHHYSDGSIENDLPMQQLSELFNVNHFIVSQANPHSALFSTLTVEATVWSPPLYTMVVGVLRFIKAQCRDWLKAFSDFLACGAIAPSIAWESLGGRKSISQLLTQEYGGRDSDITILPWRREHSVVSAFGAFMKNPSDQEYDRIVQVSKSNTWPYLSRIRAHCMVEMTLDQCVQRLRKRIANENKGGSLTAARSPRGLDRVPSFYTSRSIVNLSGLSVSDPAPLADGSTYHDDMASVMAKHQQQSLPESSRQEHQQNAANFAKDVGSEYSNVDNTVAVHHDGSQIPHDGPSGDSVRTKSADKLCDVDESNYGDSEQRHSFDESSQGPKVVEKTTNMANFYYRQAPSSNASP